VTLGKALSVGGGLPLSLSAEADAKVLGDWLASHNLSIRTGPYGQVHTDKSIRTSYGESETLTLASTSAGQCLAFPGGG
jgi:hypothetical protein